MPFLYYLTDGVREFTAGGFQLITTDSTVVRNTPVTKVEISLPIERG